MILLHASSVVLASICRSTLSSFRMQSCDSPFQENSLSITSSKLIWAKLSRLLKNSSTPLIALLLLFLLPERRKYQGCLFSSPFLLLLLSPPNPLCFLSLYLIPFSITFHPLLSLVISILSFNPSLFLIRSATPGTETDPSTSDRPNSSTHSGTETWKS